MTKVARTPLISGNWKMHHNHFEAISLVQKLSYLLSKDDYEVVDVSVHPPFTDLRSIQTVLEADEIPIALGAQHCHWEEKGAFTGEVAPAMLAKLDVTYVIAGHSERRELFGETDEMVNKKVKAIIKNEMTPILCVGETLDEREAGGTDQGQHRQGPGQCEGHAPSLWRIKRSVIGHEAAITDAGSDFGRSRRSDHRPGWGPRGT